MNRSSQKSKWFGETNVYTRTIFTFRYLSISQSACFANPFVVSGCCCCCCFSFHSGLSFYNHANFLFAYGVSLCVIWSLPISLRGGEECGLYIFCNARFFLFVWFWDMTTYLLLLFFSLSLFVLPFRNKQGQTRLSTYYEWISMAERTALESEIIRKCLSRSELQCSFVEYRGYKVVYRRYASLFFIIGTKPRPEEDDNQENELGLLEFIHTLVETMDKWYALSCACFFWMCSSQSPHNTLISNLSHSLSFFLCVLLGLEVFVNWISCINWSRYTFCWMKWS